MDRGYIPDILALHAILQDISRCKIIVCGLSQLIGHKQISFAKDLESRQISKQILGILLGG
jgi:hypothetical protein